MSLYVTQSVIDPDTDLHTAVANNDVELLASILLSNLAEQISGDGPRVPAVMALSSNTAVVMGCDAEDQETKLNEFRQAGRDVVSIIQGMYGEQIQMLALYCCVHIEPEGDDTDLRPRNNPHSRDGVLAIIWDVQPMLEAKDFGEHLDMMVNQGLAYPRLWMSHCHEGLLVRAVHTGETMKPTSKSGENEDGVTYWDSSLWSEFVIGSSALFPVIPDHNNAGSGGDSFDDATAQLAELMAKQD